MGFTTKPIFSAEAAKPESLNVYHLAYRFGDGQ
jgi:hypothetical protein